MLKLSRNIYTFEVQKIQGFYTYIISDTTDLFINGYEWQLPTLLNKFLL